MDLTGNRNDVSAAILRRNPHYTETECNRCDPPQYCWVSVTYGKCVEDLAYETGHIPAQVQKVTIFYDVLG
jgi:hypothetical protein